jgi:signal transduction histidine kinase
LTDQVRELKGKALIDAISRALAGMASVAHEVNQPLTAILANSEAAELTTNAGQDLKELLADIKRDALKAREASNRLCRMLANTPLAPQTDPSE